VRNKMSTQNGIKCVTGRDRDRDLRKFREVLGESTAIRSSRGKGIEWASQDPMILGGA
jgi:hypothetical protein